jgi:hypothetical protein
MAQLQKHAINIEKRLHGCLGCMDFRVLFHLARDAAINCRHLVEFAVQMLLSKGFVPHLCIPTMLSTFPPHAGITRSEAKTDLGWLEAAA